MFDSFTLCLRFHLLMRMIASACAIDCVSMTKDFEAAAGI